MKKLNLNKETFEVVSNEELELVGAAKKTHTTPKCDDSSRAGCVPSTSADVTCTESFCYCKS
jgi:hypothetical protein